MITANLAVRTATHADQRSISRLMAFEDHLHRHLEWRAPLDWLGWPHYWVLEEGGRLLAALACPQDPARIAWIRLFVHNASLSAHEAWSVLWEAAKSEIQAMGGANVASIALKTWFKDVLVASGFQLKQNILLLNWSGGGGSRLDRALPQDVLIRRMQLDDIPEVAAVDADAFDPLWRNSQEALRLAYTRAMYAAVAIKEDRLVGYQLTTGGAFGGHLGRLAVNLDSQGTGLGQALISDLLRWLASRGMSHLTVNTQADNVSSLKLYEKMGFTRTGEVYPVYLYTL